jgi:hypothetical protein
MKLEEVRCVCGYKGFFIEYDILTHKGYIDEDGLPTHYPDIFIPVCVCPKCGTLKMLIKKE